MEVKEALASGDGRARQRVLEVSDPSGVAEARRAIAELALPAQLDETAAGELNIAVTEAATNMLKHARHGRLVARLISRGATIGVEVLGIDGGPGIGNLDASMRDGHSTAGSPGTGLGALKRLSSGFEVWSQPGKGTLLRFEVWPRRPAGAGLAPPSPAPGPMVEGAVCLPKGGEPVSGDGWLLVQRPERVLLFVVDGLGHGPDAAKAARAAVAAAEANAARDAAAVMEAVHLALRPTRGAAGAAFVLQPQSGLCTFCGIGNIAGSLRSNGQSRSTVSHNGILGHQVRKFQEFTYPFPRGSLLVAHSDGLGSRWDLSAYPGIELRHPALAAAALYRDYSRGRDDVTVVALRHGAPAR